MSKFIEIGGRRIGKDYDPVVIAEMGINPGGNLEIAKAMVDSAYEAGIEIIKHQTHIFGEDIKIRNLERQHFYDDAETIMFTEEEEIELKNYIESKGMIFISAPFCFEAVDRLEKMNVLAYKISSTEMNNYPLVDYIASKMKPIILSTGMNDMKSVKKAVKTIKKYHDDFAIQHCTNIYPTPPEKVRLNLLKELSETFPNEIIGLSDHSLNNYACYAALSLGASIVERHFTDSKARVGKEIAWSMDKEEAKELVAFSKIINRMKDGKKELLEEEKLDSLSERKNLHILVTNKKLLKNSIITKADLTTQESDENGISVEDLYKIIWKKCTRNLPENHILTKRDFI